MRGMSSSRNTSASATRMIFCTPHPPRARPTPHSATRCSALGPGSWGSETWQPWAGVAARATLAPSRSEARLVLRGKVGRCRPTFPRKPRRSSSPCDLARRTPRSALPGRRPEKTSLKRRYRKKLCPLRPATRAGQKAIATQTMTAKLHHMTRRAIQQPSGTPSLRVRLRPRATIQPRRTAGCIPRIG